MVSDKNTESEHYTMNFEDDEITALSYQHNRERADALTANKTKSSETAATQKNTTAN